MEERSDAAISSFLLFSKNLQLVPYNLHPVKNFSSKKAGLLIESWGHSSFVFPHLRLAKSKVCPPFNNYFPKKEGILITDVEYK